MVCIAQKAVDFAIGKLGCRYSQERRWEDDVFDCSSLVYRAFKAAGYAFKSGSTSDTEVNDTEFDLLWPLSGHKQIGKAFTSVATLKKQGYLPAPGDLLYFNTNANTSRANQITHVALVESANSIVHARGTRYGVRRDDIDLYGSKVVAVTRFRSEAMEASPCAATSVCKTSVNIRETPNGSILAAVANGHPLVVSGCGEWLAVATMIGTKPVTGYIHGAYVSICSR